MRFTILVLLLAVSSTSSAGEEDDFNATTAALKHSAKKLIVVGGLRYCGNPGLSRAILQLASDSMVANLIAVDGTANVDRVGKRIIQAADEHAEGVKIGLTLSSMDPSKKASVCKEFVQLADDLLRQSQP